MVECRSLAEERIGARGVGRRDPRCIEVSETPLELRRSAERLLDGDLLIEREPDQERTRLLDQESVRFVITRERETVDRGGHAGMVAGRRSSGPDVVIRRGTFATDVGWGGPRQERS